jgi:hypothetical protein
MPFKKYRINKYFEDFLIWVFVYLDPMDMPEVKCLLQGATNRGLTWSRYNSNVLSDGTYASNTNGYQALKIDIQTRCEKETFKRELLRKLREMYEEEQQETEEERSVEDKKKK